MAERVEVLEIDLTDIQTEAEETGKTLRDLRNEVKELRATLENTEVGTKEFGDALSELTYKQQELTNVTKSGVAAQKGSYNDLVNQMAILKSQWRATADEAERTALGQKISDINTQLKELDSTVGNHQREVGNYRMVLKGLKEELLTLEEGTEEYNQKLQQAAQIAQQMQDVNEFVASSAQDMGDHLANATGVAAGMVGVFQTVQASLNLIGVESENVQKMIGTMQNLMAITQGLTAIEGAIDKYKRLNNTIKGLTIVQNLFGTSTAKSAAATTADATASTADAVAKGAQATATTTATAAQWSLNAAMAANPLGAILVAITAVVTALVALTSWLGNAGDSAESAAAKNDRLTESLDRQNDKINYNIRLLQAQGMTRKQALEANLADQTEAYNQAVDNYNSIVAEAHRTKRWLGLASSVSDDEQEQIDKAKAIMESQADALKKMREDITIEDAAEKREARERDLADQKRYHEESIRAAEQAAKEQQNIVKTAVNSIVNFRKKFFADKNDLVFELQISSKSEEDQEIERLKRNNKLKLAEVKEQFEEMKKEYKKLYENKAITKERYEKNLENLDVQYNNYEQLTEVKQGQEINKIRKKYREQDLKDTRDYLNRHSENYKIYRDRALRNVRLAEETANAALERVPAAATAQTKLLIEEGVLTQLKQNYEEQLRIIKVQDELERSLIKTEIDKLEAKYNTNNLTNEEYELLERLRDQYVLVGQEATAISEKILTITDKLSHTQVNIHIENLEESKKSLEGLKNTWSDLNDISGWASDEWTNVFDNIIAGVDACIGALKVFDNKTATTKEKVGAIFQIAAAGFQMVSSVLGAMAEEQDETVESGFEKQKKYQIAQATMSMLAGILAAWGSAMLLPPPASWIMGGIMTAATATLGAIQIAQIKKQTFDNSGGDTPSIPTLSALQMMDTGVQATTNIEGVSAESAVTDTKVYVVETDITNTQNNVKSTVAEATF